MRSIAVPMLLLSAALAQSQAHAADVTPKGADDLKQKILSALPESLIKDKSAVTVRSRKNTYEVRVNTIALFGPQAIEFTRTMGINPVVSLFKPLDGGFWQYDEGGGIDIRGKASTKDGSATFRASVDSYSVSGIYDPTVTYLKSSVSAFKGIKFRWKAGEKSTESSMDSVTITTEGTPNADNTVNFAISKTITNFAQVIAKSKTEKITVRVGSGKEIMKAEGVTFLPLQQLWSAISQNSSTPFLSEADKSRLIQLLRSNFPLFKTFSDTLVYSDLQVDTAVGMFTAKRLDVNGMIDGIRNGTHFGLGFVVTDAHPAPGAVPATFVPLLPQTAAINIDIPSVNAADGLNYVIDHVDFDSAHPMTPPQKSELGRQFFPDGSVTITYDGTHLTSSLYDISIDGRTSFTLSGTDKPLADVTIKVRDFDKAVSYLQNHVKEEPKFGQAAFFLLMAKGFAENQPDGTQLWRVETDRAGQVLVNGRPFKIPGQQ